MAALFSCCFRGYVFHLEHVQRLRFPPVRNGVFARLKLVSVRLILES
ncbi:MAG: hypothetical protein ACI87E_002769 [Mariniblastus sp.]